ncbi:MAG TPA: hypothetical protein VFY67_18500 [Pyrinomonadaceae bacterium]|nr:hypothetical protein [Pyrinomonadaceae bacterium]
MKLSQHFITDGEAGAMSAPNLGAEGQGEAMKLSQHFITDGEAGAMSAPNLGGQKVKEKRSS